MAKILSDRAKSRLKAPLHQVIEKSPLMRKFPSDVFEFWISLERDLKNVKKLSHWGSLPEDKLLMVDVVATLIAGKPLTFFEGFTFREYEAYLRDKNSEPALTDVTAEDEDFFRKFLSWLRNFPSENAAKEYKFSSPSTPFAKLKLVDKVRELKGFFNSPEVLELYQNRPRPEVIDVDDLTVYVQTSYSSDEDRQIFEKLHLLAVATYQEESLNLIPEE